MARERQLRVKARFDGKQFRTGMQQMQVDMKRLNKGMMSVGNVMKGALVGVGVSAVLQSVGAINKMIIINVPSISVMAAVFSFSIKLVTIMLFYFYTFASPAKLGF